MDQHDRPDRAGAALLVAMLLAGVGLRAWQYASNPALWLDELALVNGLLAGPASQLFLGPADFAQVAPPGFLLTEWIAQRVGGGSAYALRAPSFLLGCGALLAMAAAAREVVGPRHAWMAVGLVAVSPQLILMGAQLKPYSADACAAAVLVWLVAAELRTPTPITRRALLATGVVAPWFSFGAVFVMAGTGLVLTARRWPRGTAEERRSTALLLLAWGVSGMVSLAFASHLLNDDASAWMQTFWAPEFPVVPPQTLGDLAWPARSVLDSLWEYFGLRRVSVFALLALAGCLLLWHRRPVVAWSLVLPIVAGIGAAALHRYPFGGRVSLWLVPLLALPIVAAVARVTDAGGGRIAVRLAAGGLLLLTPLSSLRANSPPYAKDEIRPAVAHLRAHAQPGDPVYVNWGGWHSWEHYGKPVITAQRVIMGSCPSDIPRDYFRELDALRGAPRAWVVMARAQTPEIHDAMVRYLGTIGTPRDSVRIVPRGAVGPQIVHLYEFDLSDSSRLATTDAESFAVNVPAPQYVRECQWLTMMYRRGDGTLVTPRAR